MSDFTDIQDISGFFTSTELDEGVDFTESGDFGQIIVLGYGYGEGGYGEGGYGGTETIVLGIPTTIWTNVETP